MLYTATICLLMDYGVKSLFYATRGIENVYIGMSLQPKGSFRWAA